jgi:glycosyltransferase involved in cell wall biosynthesis
LRAIKAIYNPLDIALAIPKVLDRIPDAQFLIFTHNSDPELLSRFRAILHEHRVTHAVQYIGNLADDCAIAGVLQAADVAVSVPSSDGTPQSVLEALACGLAVVLSDLPSLHEWVQHETEALFVPVGDAAAIAETIIRLLVDEPLREKLRANGPLTIRQRADRMELMKRYIEIYQELREKSL